MQRMNLTRVNVRTVVSRAGRRIRLFLPYGREKTALENQGTIQHRLGKTLVEITKNARRNTVDHGAIAMDLQQKVFFRLRAMVVRLQERTKIEKGVKKEKRTEIHTETTTLTNLAVNEIVADTLIKSVTVNLAT